MQRYRVFKQMALAYAIKFSGKWMVDRFKELEGNSTTSIIQDTKRLKEIAATSAGLKALCTFVTSQGAFYRLPSIMCTHDFFFRH
jgi:hypothetical protein